LSSSEKARPALPTLSASIPVIILPITILSLPLAAAPGLGLSNGQVVGWIIALYGVPGALGLALTLRYRQPLLLTGNVFVLIFIASLGGQISYPELVGATILAGVGVVLLGLLGLTGRLAAIIPPPVVLGLLAGAIVPFVAGIFTNLGEAPAVVGGVLVAYFLSSRILGTRLPPILPALLAGLVIAALTGQLGQVPARLALPTPEFTFPVFSLPAIVTATPVILVLATVQANVPSAVFLESQGYKPPERVINVVGGLGTLAGSLLGPTAVSLSLPATALVAGPEAGERNVRHRTVYVGAGAGLALALLAGVAADLLDIVPLALLLALAGLALVPVFAGALQQITRGPLWLGPMFAFAIALSKISLFGLGPFFWALVFGTGISLLLEGEALGRLRDEEAG
jgi:benzoate membrane transport protein